MSAQPHPTARPVPPERSIPIQPDASSHSFQHNECCRTCPTSDLELPIWNRRALGIDPARLKRTSDPALLRLPPPGPANAPTAAPPSPRQQRRGSHRPMQGVSDQCHLQCFRRIEPPRQGVIDAFSPNDAAHLSRIVPSSIPSSPSAIDLVWPARPFTFQRLRADRKDRPSTT